jgi:hypothetical protein
MSLISLSIVWWSNRWTPSKCLRILFRVISCVKQGVLRRSFRVESGHLTLWNGSNNVDGVSWIDENNFLSDGFSSWIIARTRRAETSRVKPCLELKCW